MESIAGLWLRSQDGHTRHRGSEPRKWYTPYSAGWIELLPDGRLIERTISGVRRGTWQADGNAIRIQHQFRDVETYTQEDGALLHWVEDEEHGGHQVVRYTPDGPIALDEIAARLAKSKDPRTLIEKRGWLIRALWQGHIDLLRLVLRYGGEFSVGRLEHLNDCPPDLQPALIDLLLSHADALGRCRIGHTAPGDPPPTFVGYLALRASPAVIDLVRARSDGAPLITAALIELLSSEPYYTADTLPALIAAAPTADLRDAQGVPLFVHAVLKARTEWVRLILPKASAAACLTARAQLAGEWGSREFPAGIDARQAAALAIAGIEEAQATRGHAPWRAAQIETIRDNVALLP